VRVTHGSPIAQGAVDAPAAPVHDFWSALPPDDAAALAARGAVRRFERGQALMYQGQHPDRIVLIRSGRARVSFTTPNGREVILAFSGPGELVGELSSFDDQPRSASVVALEPVEALCVSNEDFQSFLAERPAASLTLLRLLSRRLRDADVKLVEYAAVSTIGRVATRLLELGERFGEEEDGAVRIALPLTQEELAGWVGTSLESVARSLQTMRRLHWIETARRQIRILDQEALKRAAA
jgi:CRP/FNR family cyclic AMP-dependent transcriptional regulator